MSVCKNCKSEEVVKSGKVRGKQRYKCKDCGYNFVNGDERTNEKRECSPKDTQHFILPLFKDFRIG
jgi:transposase-like protein